MISLNEVKVGKIVKYDDKLYEVIWAQHSKVGRGGAILRSKIKNLLTGAIIDKTFKGNEKLEEVDLERKKYQYLYAEDGNYYFMDPVNFEQITLNEEQVGSKKDFLVESTDLEIVFHDEKPLSLIMPIKMTFQITYTEPGIKGDTKSSTSLKSAQIQTGATIKVPLFINSGEKVVVDTRDGSYVERA